MIKKIIKLFLIFLSIFIGGIAIAVIFCPTANTDAEMASNAGRGIGYAGLIALFIWAIIGTFKKLKEKDKNIKSWLKLSKTAIIIIIVVFASMVFSVLNTLKNDSIDSKGWTDASKSSFKKGILESCGSEGTEVCTCYADYLIKRYSLDELTKMQQKMTEADNLPQEFNEAIKDCISK